MVGPTVSSAGLKATVRTNPLFETTEILFCLEIL